MAAAAGSKASAGSDMVAGNMISGMFNSNRFKVVSFTVLLTNVLGVAYITLAA